MLSLDQVDHFITNHLKFPNWKTILNEDRVEFLRQIVKNHVTNIYMQGMTMAATEPSKRTNPTIDDIIKIGVSGAGGCCIHLNYFIHLVLKTLDFDAFVTIADVPVSKLRGDHCVTIVKMSEDEIYLMDVGFVAPNTEIIPLHALPYRAGSHGGIPQEYRYSKDKGVYERYQLKAKYFKGDFPPGKTEDLKYTFKLVRNEIADFDSSMKIIFTDQSESIFLKHAVLFRHFEEDGKMKFVIIWGKDLLIGDEDMRHVTKYWTYQDLRPVINKYFPKLNDNELTIALKSFVFNETRGFLDDLN